MKVTEFIELVRSAQAEAQAVHGSADAYHGTASRHAMRIAKANLDEQAADLLPHEIEEANEDGSLDMYSLSDLKRWVDDIFDDEDEVETNTVHVKKMVLDYFKL